MCERLSSVGRSAFELPTENRQDQNRKIVQETLDLGSSHSKRPASIDVNIANIDPQAWLAQQLLELNMDQAQFDEAKVLLFSHLTPFSPRPNNMIDKKIAKILRMTKSGKVPVRHIDRDTCLVGLRPVIIFIKGDYLQIEAEGKQERFANYLMHNKENLMN